MSTNWLCFCFSYKKSFLSKSNKNELNLIPNFVLFPYILLIAKLTRVGIMVLYLLVHVYHVLFISNMYCLYTVSVEKVFLC